MKKIITIILFLAPLFIKAQTAPPILQGSKLYEFRNGLRIDSAAFMPRRDTFTADPTMKAPGMVLYREADSLLYFRNSFAWKPISSTSATPTLQSVTDVGNTTSNAVTYTGVNNIPTVAGLTIGNGIINSGDIYGGTYSPLQISGSGISMVGSVGVSLQTGSGNNISVGNDITLSAGHLFFNSGGIGGGFNPAVFNSRVSGSPAAFMNEFITKQQEDSTATALKDQFSDSLLAQNLQRVTNNGNTTTNKIMIGSGSTPAKQFHVTGSSLTSDTTFIGDPTNASMTPALTQNRNISGNLVSVISRQSSGYYTAPGRSLLTFPSFATGISSGNPAVSYVWSHVVGGNTADVTFRSGTNKGVWIGPDTLTNSILKLYVPSPAYGTSVNVLTVKDSTQTQFLYNLTVKNNRPRLTFRDSTSDYELHVPDSAHLRKALIGDTIPLTALFPWYDLTLPGGLMMMYSNGSSNPTIESRRFNGTFNTPTTVLKGNSLLGIMASPFNGTTFGTKGSIAITASEDHTSSTAGTYVNFQTTNKGTTVRRVVAAITDTGSLMIANLSAGLFNSNSAYDSSIGTLDIVRMTDTSSHSAISVRGKIPGSGIYMKRISFSVSDAGNTYVSGLEIGLPGTLKYDTYYRDSATNRLTRLSAGIFGQFLQAGPGGKPQWANLAGGSGSVSSVALSLPSIFSVTGSPVTTTGTLTGTLATQIANTVFAGPTTGGAATPTFRSLVEADLPSIAAINNGFATTSDADYTVQATDRYILLIQTTALRTLTLPNPASGVRELWVRCAATGSGQWQTGTVGFVGCGQIGTPPFSPSSNVAFASNTTIHLVSNGTSWHCFQ